MLQSTHCRNRHSFHHCTLRILGASIACACLCTICLVPTPRMQSFQARYHQLSEKNKTLQTEVANLEAECRKLQAERNQSEQELVFLDKEAPMLFAKQQNISQPPSATGEQLSELASGTNGLDFDAASGAMSLTPEAFFQSGTSLKTASGEPLGTLASVLNES